MGGIRSFLEEPNQEAGTARGCACIVPHAGWSFSGKTAARGISSLTPCDVIVLAGGHLGAGDSIQLLPFSTYNTPAGSIETDQELAAAVQSGFDVSFNSGVDNTTEVQLPLIAYFHPETPIVVLRVPPAESAAELGIFLANYQKKNSIKVAVIGSTDLTHYGPGYGFTPMGETREAYSWVREVNDKRFITAAIKGDIRQLLQLSLAERSACSAGAAAAASSFAFAAGCRNSELLEYTTSYDQMPSENLVGYAAILYSPL
jgi:MEMO1 family protein